jgi:hypothetical protein
MDEYDWADQERLVRQDVEEIERNMNELTLVVKQNPGSIEINFDELEQRLDEKLAEYDGIIFTAETKDIGKKEAASLRNLKKDIDATRKAVKKKWMEPYDEFDTQMKAYKSPETGKWEKEKADPTRNLVLTERIAGRIVF